MGSANTGSITAEDGTCIEFTVQGTGPGLLLTNGLTTTDLFWKYLIPRWQSHYTIVTWDLPGHGISSPARSEYTATIEAQPALMAKVMDAVGLTTAIQGAFSVGCQIALEMARQFPERCDALLLLLGAAQHVLSTTRLPIPGPLLLRLLRDTPDEYFVPFARGFASLAKTALSFHGARAIGLVGKQASRRDIDDMTEHLSVLDPGTIRRMAASAEAHSAFNVLGSLTMPLLIMAGDRDPFAPAQTVGWPMHRAAPTSEFVRLKHGTHTALLDDPEPIAEIVEQFLARRLNQPALTDDRPA
ncbi:MAG: alpha/beta hydrolase [Myxococcales bacterium]